MMKRASCCFIVLLFLRLSQAFELAGEVAHQLGFPGDLKTALDGVATVVDVLEGGGDDVHVVVGVDAARDAETHEVVATEAVLAGYRVAVGQYVADLTGTDAGLEVQLTGEGLSGEFLFRDVGQHLVGVDEDGVTTGGTLVRNAVLVEFGGQVMDLLDAGLNHLELKVLFQTHGQAVHIAAIHTAVGEEALEGDAEHLGTFVPVLLVGGDETAHVDQTVLLGAHGHAVSIAEHLHGNLAEGLVLVAFLAGLDEVAVLNEAGTIDIDGHTVFVAQLAGLADVLHRDGLAAHGVVGHGEDHEGHIALVLLQHLLQLLEAHITLEGHLELRVVGLGDGHVDGEGLAALDVALGGVEVGIAGHHHAGLDQVGEQHVLGRAALVRRDDVLEARDVGDGVLHVVERAGAAVALVAHHHGAPLAVAHGAGAGVGEEVDVDVVGFEHEDVLVGFFEPFLTLFAGGFADGFDHLDFPSFCKG